jgi:hypothetical protein
MAGHVLHDRDGALANDQGRQGDSAVPLAGPLLVIAAKVRPCFDRLL